MKRVLVVGAGGREHALLKALSRSPQKTELFCAPGNAGMAADANCLPNLQADDIDGLAEAASSNEIDLTVVGPEAPLVDGIVDRFKEEGLAIFGPSAAAARLEGSKAYAKQVMNEAGVPTASCNLATSFDQALAFIEESSFPVVLKADGLAAGKGVIIANDREEAQAALNTFYVEKKFGAAASQVLVEEFLEGEELSLLAICDGTNVVAMAPAQDYKRIFDQDRGPNTGGMGSYSPVPGIDWEAVAAIAADVHEPVVRAMKARGEPIHGVLYAGLMLTSRGPRVLEFNCRFGDPETQAILPRLKSDLLEVLELAAKPGGLQGYELEWSDDWAVDVVLASRGYPASSSSGDVITGLDQAEAIEGVEVVHAGTASDDGKTVTAGGRVLGVTAVGESIIQARKLAYSAVERIKFDGMQYRSDIAARAVEKVKV